MKVTITLEVDISPFLGEEYNLTLPQIEEKIQEHLEEVGLSIEYEDLHVFDVDVNTD